MYLKGTNYKLARKYSYQVGRKEGPSQANKEFICYYSHNPNYKRVLNLNVYNSEGINLP